MKKILIFLIAILACAVEASNIEQLVPPKEEGETSCEKEARNGFFPGIVNLATCWLEVPRAFTYETTARPRSMIVLAPLLGTSFTALRALQGTGNVLTLGLCDQFIRGDLPQYVWEDLWLARKPEID